jgi:hypothetical protein
VEWRSQLLPEGVLPAGSAKLVAAMQYVLELEALCIAMASGELLLLYTTSREVRGSRTLPAGR